MPEEAVYNKVAKSAKSQISKLKHKKSRLAIVQNVAIKDQKVGTPT